MRTRDLLIIAWHFNWSVNIGCAAALAIYFWKVDAVLWRRLVFATAILVLLLSLESPIDVLGDEYLFSVHMAAHLMMIVVAAPLFVLAISEQTARAWLRIPFIARTERRLGRPAVAWFSAIVAMTVWHVPALYNFALAHAGAHIFEHITFLVTATMFWWPVFHPIPERRLHTGAATLYLFGAAAESSVLGIILTFIRPGHYPAYLHPRDSLGALHLIRKVWGVSPALDQQLGGLLMWIPGCSIYFIAILGLLAVWYSQPEVDRELRLPESLTEHESIGMHEKENRENSGVHAADR